MVQIVSTYFCYPTFDYAQIGRVHFFTQPVSILLCAVGVSCWVQRGGAPVDLLEVQAKVGNMDLRPDYCPVAEGGERDAWTHTIQPTHHNQALACSVLIWMVWYCL
jgi:hypothetical protein